ncbi:unnamed protein product [Rotaria sordida]|uniref:Uncharacterized protein n=1 Tax=Rotaria sordida TaxID=392033 RepID=A0A813R251_9BILA|nr:unnamed protein product [Rotaria sordida]CAF0808089.1 unnamed protein product [Rotaria sordida]
MATGYSDRTNRRIGFSAFVVQNRDDQHSTNPDDMTLKIVRELKRIVQNKINQGDTITQPIFELEVAKIKRDYDPYQCDIERLKAQLPHDIKNCPDSILRVSMAYGNDPQQIESVIKSKMKIIDSNDNIDAGLLDNIIEPLKLLKKDMERNPIRNIFNAVHNINDHNTDRVDRLFLSEVHHFTPSLRDYKFDNAHKAVQAIRNTTYESNKPEDLLAIVKTVQETDDIRDLVNSMARSSIKQNESTRTTTTTTTSRFSDDDHHSSVNTRMNDRNRFNEDRNSPHSYSPVPDPQQNSLQYPNRQLDRLADQARDRSNDNSARRDSGKK